MINITNMRFISTLHNILNSLTVASMSGSAAICCRFGSGLPPRDWPRDWPRDIALEGGGINRPVFSEYCVRGRSYSFGCCCAISCSFKPIASVRLLSSSLHLSVTGTRNKNKIVWRFCWWFLNALRSYFAYIFTSTIQIHWISNTKNLHIENNNFVSLSDLNFLFSFRMFATKCITLNSITCKIHYKRNLIKFRCYDVLTAIS